MTVEPGPGSTSPKQIYLIQSSPFGSGSLESQGCIWGVCMCVCVYVGGGGQCYVDMEPDPRIRFVKNWVRTKMIFFADS